MDKAEALLGALDFIVHETALFAAVGFLVLGLGDVLVDLIWLTRAFRRRIGRSRNAQLLRVETLPEPTEPGLLAVFTPAWDEAAVIGTMLRHTLATFRHGDYRLYVGCYPNDPATIAEAEAVGDPRVRLVIGPVPGPTTKADCLNRMWERMLADEIADGRRVKAIVLHDAEDVVDPHELRVFDSLIERSDFVQLPVLPLIHPQSRWVSGHYADEFAESHAKELVVRELLGAAIPSAGVGCAFAREALAGIAAKAGGAPFDAASLTEDYELGLKLRASGGTQAFVRIAGPDGRPISTREYFPATFEAAIGQKARWMTGIALSGWDRLGWSGGMAERWMRLRDRQSVLAAVFLFIGYVSLGLWALLKMPELTTNWEPRPVSETLAVVLAANLAMLVWRLAVRFSFVTFAYGWRQGLLSMPRLVIGNYIAMRAAWRAIARYRDTKRSGRTRWDKTAHAFPAWLGAD